MTCRHCGGPKPSGQGRSYCSDRCRELGPAVHRDCQDCGEPKLVPDQIKAKAKFCAECLRKRARAYAKRHYAEHRDEVLAKAKVYADARRDELRAKKREHYRRNREMIRAQQAEYARAHREEARERNRRWYRANRESALARSDAWRKANPERRQVQIQTWYRNMRADPGRYQRRLEDARMSARMKAEREGRPLKPVPEATYRKRYGNGRSRLTGRVDTAPLRELLSDLEGFDTLASLTSLSESFISRIANGQTDRIALRDADEICIALDFPISLLYPDDYEEAEAA